MRLRALMNDSFRADFQQAGRWCEAPATAGRPAAMRREARDGRRGQGRHDGQPPSGKGYRWGEGYRPGQWQGRAYAHGRGGGHGRGGPRGGGGRVPGGDGGGHGGGGRRGPRGRGGPGRSGRFFGHGDLRLVLLALIAEKPRHGYDLIRSITEATAGAYSPSAGVVYPTLTLLEDLGHVKAVVDAEQRKLYEITPDGQASLDSQRVPLAALQARIGTSRSPEIDAQVAQVRAAMDGLKQALRASLSAGPVDADGLRRIIEAIDAAARAVDTQARQ